MKRKLKKAAVVMSLIPMSFLLMAMKPALPPVPKTSSFTEFTYSFVEKEITYNHYGSIHQKVVFDIENTSDYFAEQFSLNYLDTYGIFEPQNADKSITSPYQPYRSLLAPHSICRYETTLRFERSERFDETSDFSIVGHAYQEKVDLTVNSYSLSFVEKNSSNLYVYFANFDLDYKDDGKNELYLTFTFVNEGNEYNFFDRITDKKAKIEIDSESEIAEADIEIQNVQLLRGRTKTNLQPFLNAVTTFLLICLMAVLALVGVLVVVIVLSVRRGKRKQLTMSDIDK